METRPYLWGGRFYNHKKDSITLRLSRAATCLAGKCLRKLVRKKYGCCCQITPENWIVSENVSQSSISPAITPVITWIGHSSFLIQVGGFNILTDPVFFNVPMFAPRVLRAGIQIDKLPKIDFVLISHNHRDHMDVRSLKLLNENRRPIFLVPHGNRRWLERHKICNVLEKFWGEEYLVANDIKFTFLPACHWTSRGILDINTTLWGSWMIESAGFKIYFAGDTAYAGHFEKIGKKFECIDIALLPIGPINPRKLIDEAHTCPAQAVKGFLDLNAKHLIPMHWGTFQSAYESFSAPAEILLESWEDQSEKLQDKILKVLKVGETFRL